MGSDDHIQIVKGKRTKRQRSSSPFGSSSGTSGDDCYNNSVSFPTTSGEIYESTEEEEDMANCLIMLAQGNRPRENIDNKVQKLTVATVASNNNKVGFYVYECKTCNRSFPSFQALGGHRASHKKHEATVLEAEKKSPVSSPSVAAVVPVKDDAFNYSDSPFHHHQKGNKIHECSICGSEFTSGQALGGHMRRHRAAANTNNNNQVTVGDVKSPAAAVAVAATTRKSILQLDLNLPAPEDDHHIQFGTNQQSLVFSGPALVDCHY